MSVSTIGFLGAGKMATALAKGFLQAGLVTADHLAASDVHPGARDGFARETGARVTASNSEVAAAADVLILAVKPDQVCDLLAELRDSLNPKRHLLISIAAGVPLSRLEAAAPGHRFIRVMPNTPALVSASASAYSPGSHATKADGELAQKLLGSVGLALELKEKLLDAVTGLSGSGPAYAFIMIEALADGGVAAGLPRDVAQKLAAQTLLGAAKMVLETGLHPAALKDAVCSPAGTTIEAVHEMEKAGIRAGLINAVRASAEKSKKLGQG
ncbi:MAG TPA: pyrroline-5-carboxylate reductase [Candidatus Limnocylindria bacterium]|nr:pyrroline-5-carboxylate reductase [Candidatus Limnocylindria bacterium]